MDNRYESDEQVTFLRKQYYFYEPPLKIVLGNLPRIVPGGGIGATASTVERTRPVLPVIVEDLSEHTGVSVEEVLVEHRIVVGQRLGQPTQSRGRYFLQRGLVRLVPDAADVQHHPVFGVYVQYVHHSARADGASRRLRLVTTYHVNLKPKREKRTFRRARCK